MAEFPALPLFTDSYLGDTRHLSTLQHGAYVLMLMVAWRAPDCALPDDDGYLARVTGLDRRTWNANKATLLSFWKLNCQQKWEQGRLKDERNYVERLRSKNADAGRASALKRKERGSTGVQPERDGNSTPTPTPTIPPNTPPLFDEFWQAFPRGRIGSRGKAEKAYAAALGRTDPETILAAAKAYAASDEVARGYAKGAAAWLNDDRWGVFFRRKQHGPREVLG